MPVRKNLTPEDFTRHPRVIAVLEQLADKTDRPGGPRFNFKDLIVSDTFDAEGRQYVNLVQEGGGVLGVALVGYTYILEKTGIRFMRLAGTSAGAINTMLMSVVKEDKKNNLTSSERILQYLCNKPFFDFVDGHPFAKKLIKTIIKTENFGARLRKAAKGIGITLGALLLLDIVATGLRTKYPVFHGIAITSYILTGIMLMAFGLASGYGAYLFQRLKNRGFGINPGKNFTDWVAMILEENGVKTIGDLERVSGQAPAGLHVQSTFIDKNYRDNPTKGLVPDITLITSDIITQNKIEFPRMWDLFRVTKDSLHPAEFVRASMSIPIFFESHIIRDIPREHPDIKASWAKHLLMEPKDIPSSVRFVDGGVLSNFPINILYNPEIIVPRLPTFGIELDDATEEDVSQNRADQLGLGSYLGKLFNTIRYYYDKDFLLKNKLFRKGIGVIKVADFNWLDFNISEDKQKELFIRGAEAARDFLLQFKWEEYKQARIIVHEAVNTSDKDARERLNKRARNI
ncbi:patatin-like phospholipase family protein [Chitinophaga sp. GCM10012297]|uniref:Patatin-like phospholipase family protein n=1 Tax=Chitinophaga chungangae TaxID=2821488 RepID=A0ABS3YI96_9BACT|nr:patatin-like phospholipase family protein [Chitinophaga chungangae]MBO9154410.1 patatin-like phospholipase family protein [Chitinophaga chungangae]